MTIKWLRDGRELCDVKMEDTQPPTECELPMGHEGGHTDDVVRLFGVVQEQLLVANEENEYLKIITRTLAREVQTARDWLRTEHARFCRESGDTRPPHQDGSCPVCVYAYNLGEAGVAFVRVDTIANETDTNNA